MKRLYHDDLYRFDTPQSSYWEATASDIEVAARPLESDESCDVAVIGAGYTGLSAALHLARDHGVDVRVLEAGHIGWGASGRNGGFCCPGGTGTNSTDLIRLVGLDNAREFGRVAGDAVELVREIGASEDIDFQAQGSAELMVAHTEKAYAKLRNSHEIATEQLGLDYELLSPDAVRERCYDSTEQYGGLLMRPCFGLHPLRYCKGLANAALRRGATLHPRSEVRRWQKSDDGRHRLSTAAATLTARRVILATNGFTPENLNAEFFGRTLPVISAIIVTRPLSEDELAAQGWKTQHPVANTRRILNYYRVLPDKRLLFGGRAYGLGDSECRERTAAGLKAMMKRIWPAWSPVSVDYSWHGLICFTATLCPSVGQLDEDPSVYFGFGYHGNGVNSATWTGKQLAQLVATGVAEEVPEFIRGLSKKLPLPGLRTRYLRAGIALSAWLDRRG